MQLLEGHRLLNHLGGEVLASSPRALQVKAPRAMCTPVRAPKSARAHAESQTPREANG
jgi:hypothetical protein